MTRFTWPKVYEFLEISYSSSKICVKSVAVDMFDSTREGRHGAVELFWNRNEFQSCRRNNKSSKRENRENANGKDATRHLVYRTPQITHGRIIQWTIFELAPMKVFDQYVRCQLSLGCVERRWPKTRWM